MNKKKETKIDREVKFVDWWHSANKGVPTYADAIEWAREKAIKDVCHWLSLNMTATIYVGTTDGSVLQKPKLISQLKKAMED